MDKSACPVLETQDLDFSYPDIGEAVLSSRTIVSIIDGPFPATFSWAAYLPDEAGLMVQTASCNTQLCPVQMAGLFQVFHLWFKACQLLCQRGPDASSSVVMELERPPC